MMLTIHPLTVANTADFFDFFDTKAFADHEEWAGCYCLESHLRSENNVEYRPDGTPVRREDRRAAAQELIEAGILTGYLVYDGDTAVGWCNAGDKTTFGPIIYNPALTTEAPPAGDTKSIYCMDIAAEYRGRKIADQLLERVIDDARAEGYRAVEGYPFTNTDFAYQYRGPRHLYEKHGFQMVRDAGWIAVYRLELHREGSTPCNSAKCVS